MKKCVIVTGGGSGGHLFPLQSVCQEIKKRGVPIIYIGRNHALEKSILENLVDNYYCIPVGKLRRNWSLKVAFHNVVDVFKTMVGLVKSFLIVGKIISRHPQSVVFSTGGFVSVTPIVSCFLRRIPIVIHEQTSQAGLANRISGVMADTICTSFKKSNAFFKAQKTVYVGYPLREVFYRNSSRKNLPNFSDEIKKIAKSKKPIVLFSGGSNGSSLINEWVKENLDRLLKKYAVCHQTGTGFLDDFLALKASGQTNRSRNDYRSYHPLGLVSGEEWAVIMQWADVVVGRSGAGIVHECIHLGKKAIFIPLAIAQKNEQYYNAVSARDSIDVIILKEGDLKSSDILKLIDGLLEKKQSKKKYNFTKIEQPSKKITDLLMAKVK